MNETTGRKTCRWYSAVYSALRWIVIGFLVSVVLCGMVVHGAAYLKKQGSATQLIVDGKPFLMLGVETTNKLLEDVSDLEYLDENLQMYRDAGVNTVLIPVAWYSFEPEEDRYDYTMIDALIDGCRRHDLKLIVLWFGAIKNGGLHFAPDWVRDDTERFFRALKPDGSETFAVSPFCRAALEEDTEAFTLLMRRIKEKDKDGDTVIMVQPENETGCQEIDNTRDQSEAANRVWNSEAPEGLMQYLAAHEDDLSPWLKDVWERNGKKTEGAWPEVFGKDSAGQKIFMSYFTARFVEQVASAGRTEYDLPMFVNDWLGSLDAPGGPIGGPDFQVMDVWRCAAPTIDIYATDIYKWNFKDWCAAFHQKGNPLMIPEAPGTRASSAAQAWYAFFEHDAMLYAPYLNIGDEYNPDHSKSAEYFRRNHLDASYPLLRDMSGLILEKQGRQPSEMIAFMLDKDESGNAVFERQWLDYTIKAEPAVGFPEDDDEARLIPPFAVVVKMDDAGFLVAGTKMTIEIHAPGIGVANAQKGRFKDGEWMPGESVDVEDAGDFIKYNLTNGAVDIEQVKIGLTE
ncbi:MAG: DUF5597 domain-containing protein [Verrucomicrobia bacterium]|nr:DUF5597 domain-containing protein [Verrucomicrobiota bacterium]